MNPFQRELQRLYGTQAAADPGLDPGAPCPVDAQGRVRSMVLELARPADWAALSPVWVGVQADLALPAPAIAVNGRDGCQLWFSLLEKVTAPTAWAFLDALRLRYLADIAPRRVTLLPAPDAASAKPSPDVQWLPASQADSGMWSAFVASDLVPMFDEEPWLDVMPNPDGQARLLVPLKSIAPADFELALQRLRPAAPAVTAHAETKAAASPDPRRFLVDVMNDDSVNMVLRVEAAKALLPYFDAARCPSQGPVDGNEHHGAANAPRRTA